MKAYTDLEQSKRLAEILPLESADMFWYKDAVTTEVNPRIMNYTQIPELQSMYYSPCWSLAALLDVYPMVVGRDMDMYCCWQNSKNLHSRHYDNPVDACVEMIMRLHELNLL